VVDLLNLLGASMRHASDYADLVAHGNVFGLVSDPATMAALGGDAAVGRDLLLVLSQYQQQQQQQQQPWWSDRETEAEAKARREGIDRAARERVQAENRLRSLADGFLRRFAREVRAIICDRRAESEAAELGRRLTPGMAALAALVMDRLGYPEPIAVGFATYLFTVIAESARAALCGSDVPPQGPSATA
jgi:hypothetical protein